MNTNPTNNHSDLCKTVLTPGVYNAAFDFETQTLFLVIDKNSKTAFVDGRRTKDDEFEVNFVTGSHDLTNDDVTEIKNDLIETIKNNNDICNHCIHRFNYYLTGECKELFDDERTFKFYEINIV